MKASLPRILGWVASPLAASVSARLVSCSRAFADAGGLQARMQDTPAHIGLVTLCAASEPSTGAGPATTGYSSRITGDDEIPVEQIHLLDTSSLVRQFGTEAPVHADGTFVAAWQAGPDELAVIHDIAGIAPVFYAEMADVIVFATDLNLLLCCGDFRRLDPHSLAAWTRQGFSDQSRTIYEGVSRLPPASALSVRWNGKQLALEVSALAGTTPVKPKARQSAGKPIAPLEPQGPESAAEAFNAIPGLAWGWGQPEDFRWELAYINALNHSDRPFLTSDLGRDLFMTANASPPRVSPSRSLFSLLTKPVRARIPKTTVPGPSSSPGHSHARILQLVNLASRLSHLAARHGNMILFPWLNRLQRQLLTGDTALGQRLSSCQPRSPHPRWSGFGPGDPSLVNLYDAFQRIGHGDSPTLQFFRLNPLRTRRLVPDFAGTTHEEATRVAVLMLSFDYLARMRGWSF